MRITQASIARLSLPEQYFAYCAHSNNTISNPPPRPPGLRQDKQAALFNNWRNALWDWIATLPVV